MFFPFSIDIVFYKFDYENIYWDSIFFLAFANILGGWVTENGYGTRLNIVVEKWCLQYVKK